MKNLPLAKLAYAKGQTRVDGQKEAESSGRSHFPTVTKRPVTLKQNRAILHPMMLISIAI